LIARLIAQPKFTRESVAPPLQDVALRLKHLEIGHHQNKGVGDYLATALATQVLPVNTMLASLHVEHSAISSSGASALAFALNNNSTVTELNLAKNFNITSGGAVAIAKMLLVNRSVAHLFVACNKFGTPVGSEQIDLALDDERRPPVYTSSWCRCFQSTEDDHVTVTTPSSNNEMNPDVGAVALAEALKVNKTLTDRTIFLILCLILFFFSFCFCMNLNLNICFPRSS
jgi:hypothetical protein